MRLIEKITNVKPRAPTAADAPRGNLDDELRAEANDRLTQSPYDKPSMQMPSVPPPRNAMPSPFDMAPHTAQPKRMAFTLTPNVRSLILTTDQEVESHVEEKDGRVTLTLKWLAALAFLLLLPSCAGTIYEPCVSITTASGKEVKACVRIERSAQEEKEEGKRSGGEEEK